MQLVQRMKTRETLSVETALGVIVSMTWSRIPNFHTLCTSTSKMMDSSERASVLTRNAVIKAVSDLVAMMTLKVSKTKRKLVKFFRISTSTSCFILRIRSIKSVTPHRWMTLDDAPGTITTGLKLMGAQLHEARIFHLSLLFRSMGTKTSMI